MTGIWLGFMSLGTLVPAALFALSRARLERWPKGLAVLALAGGVALLSPAFHLSNFLLALFQSAIHAWARPRSRARRELGLYFGVAWLGWEIFSRLIWWDSLDSFALDNRDGLVLFAGLVAAVSYFLSRPEATRRGPRASLRAWLFELTAAVILVLFAFRVPEPRFSLAHHWGAIAGPAELVRQGHVLYRDMPAQYGFLSTLTLAAWPAPTPWHSLYALQALFLLLGGAVLYRVLCSAARVPGWRLCALLATIGAVFVFPGAAPEGIGPYGYPTASFFRFFWVFALVSSWIVRAQARSFEDRRWAWGGSILWLLGTLWSFESAIYCFFAWLLPHLIAERKRPARAALPLALLAAAAALVALVYRLKAGRLPEFVQGFTEYALSFAGGFAPEPLDPAGAASALLLTYLVLAVALLRCWREDPLSPRALAVLSLSGAFWSVCSYFVARSHPNNATNLVPFLVLACAGLAVLFRGDSARRFAALLVPLVSIAGFGSLKGGFVAKVVRDPAWSRPVSSFLPKADPEALELLKQAGDTPWDLVSDRGGLFVSDSGGRWKEATSWLPLSPYVLYKPLPLGRREVYFRRFLLSVPFKRGCLLSDSSLKTGETAWIGDFLTAVSWKKESEAIRGDWRWICYSAFPRSY